jgi:2-amino-4-hydroxy-6-hydroxymethyldihydropteridine diphosphokinase
MNPITTYIALGSNLNNPVEQLDSALTKFARLPNSAFVKVSSYYQNPAHGPPQPDFVNAVAELRTTLSALDLLKALHQIEQQQGRVRTHERNGPRTLDLDIILYGNEVIDNEVLNIPHPRLAERPFVLIPLYEIAPDLVFPNGSLLKQFIHEELYHHLTQIGRI